MNESTASQQKQKNVLWSVKYCVKAGAKLFLLTCKLSEGSKISSDHKRNILVQRMNDNIILDCQNKTHDSRVASAKHIKYIDNLIRLYNYYELILML